MRRFKSSIIRISLKVDITVNGQPVSLQMKLGANGEAFFVKTVLETDVRSCSFAFACSQPPTFNLDYYRHPGNKLVLYHSSFYKQQCVKNTLFLLQTSFSRFYSELIEIFIIPTSKEFHQGIAKCKYKLMFNML